MGDSLMFMRQLKYILSKLIKAIIIVIKLLSKYAECTKDFNNSQNYFCAVVLKFSIKIGRSSKVLWDCNGISTNMYLDLDQMSPSLLMLPWWTPKLLVKFRPTLRQCQQKEDSSVPRDDFQYEKKSVSHLKIPCWQDYKEMTKTEKPRLVS